MASAYTHTCTHTHTHVHTHTHTHTRARACTHIHSCLKYLITEVCSYGVIVYGRLVVNFFSYELVNWEGEVKLLTSSALTDITDMNCSSVTLSADLKQ